MDDLDLVRLELETLWVVDGDGRLLRERTSEPRPAPLVTVAATDGGLCSALAAGLPLEVAARLAATLAADAPSRPGAPVPAVGWRPDCAGAVIDLLAAAGALGAARGGPSYLVARPLPVPGGIDVLTSDDGGRAGLRGRMPEEDRESLLEPWAVAMVDGRVAAVCETARSAPASVEAGLWTYEPYRRRGFGAAATAAWSALVADRTAFYSTSWANAPSQGVARRLGLRPLAQWWQVHAA